MQKQKRSTFARKSNTRARLAYPLVTGGKGRLAVVTNEPDAVRQLFAFVRDIEIGDLHGDTELSNPCLRVGRGSLKAMLDDVAVAVRRLLKHARLADVIVKATPAKTNANCLGWLTVRGDGWQLRLHVLRRESGLALRT